MQRSRTASPQACPPPRHRLEDVAQSPIATTSEVAHGRHALAAVRTTEPAAQAVDPQDGASPPFPTEAFPAVPPPRMKTPGPAIGSARVTAPGIAYTLPGPRGQHEASAGQPEA